MVCQEFADGTWSVKVNNALSLILMGWTCEERQTCLPYGYKCIIMSKRENVKEQDTNRDANMVVT